MHPIDSFGSNAISASILYIGCLVARDIIISGKRTIGSAGIIVVD